MPSEFACLDFALNQDIQGIVVKIRSNLLDVNWIKKKVVRLIIGSDGRLLWHRRVPIS